MKKTRLLTLLLVLCCAIFVLVACDNDTDKETQTTEETEDLGKNDKEEPSDKTPTDHTHTYGEWTVTKEASCTEKGSEKRVCTCGEEEDREIEMKAHTKETVPGKDATCAESGLTEGEKCSVCGWVFVKQEEIATKGNHVYQNLKCTVCGLELTPSEGLYFALNTDGESYYVSDFGICTDRDVVIPYTYEGNPVTGIGEYAFEDCTGVRSVIIPDSVTSIGDEAFYECTGLTSVTLGNGITSISDSMFEGCTGLTSITIPDSVTNIGEKAFAGCTGLTSIIIPDSVTSIDGLAFGECTGLTSVTIGNGITSISYEAFFYCEGLTSVTIGNSVTSIDQAAFYYCTKLTDINYSGTKAQWQAIKKERTWDHLTGNYTVHCTDGDISKK